MKSDVDYQRKFQREYILTINDLLFRQGIRSHLDFLQKAQWWERERIYEYQLSTLKKLLEISWREVPFYRQLYNDFGVSPDDFRNLEDLAKFPLTTKTMLRENYPANLVRKTGYPQFKGGSSGSTGEHFRVIKDNYTLGLNQATHFFEYLMSGWRWGEPHLQMGMTLKRNLQKKLKDRLLNCHYVSAFDLTDARLDHCLETLEGKKIAHLWGYAGSLYVLSQRASKIGWNRPLKAIVSWGDNLFPHYRKALESTFKTKVYDTYGCGEGILVAAQCGKSEGYHIHDFDTIVEFVRNDGSPAAPNETANIILTRLHPGPMPLIRYKVGDLGIKGDDSPCPCGRGLSLMKSVEGRDSDIVIAPDGNRLIVHFFTGIFEHYPQVSRFQVVQEGPESIHIKFIPAGDFKQTVMDEIIADMRRKGADNMKITAEAVDSIPLEKSNKRRFVINRMTDLDN